MRVRDIHMFITHFCTFFCEILHNRSFAHFFSIRLSFFLLIYKSVLYILGKSQILSFTL
jgi:hypothetical protein